MEYTELLDGLKAAGTWPTVGPTSPAPRKQKPTAASLSIDDLADTIDEAIARYVEPLEARIKELEARPTMKYMGVWEQGHQYNPGEFVTDQGSVWHCNFQTGSRPGSGPQWILAVKKGSDGREAQPRMPSGTAQPR
jgi:hypothetical protein